MNHAGYRPSLTSRQIRLAVRSMRISVICLAGAPLLLSACASEQFVGRPGLEVTRNEALPPPGVQDLIQQRRAYVVGPYDTVDVNVYGVSDVSRTVTIDASGALTLPLIGEINAGGLGTVELSKIIANKLRRYVRNPQVTVSANKVSQSFTVDGQVKLPGQYPIDGPMTLMRSVARAQGVSDFAATNYVVVFRQVNGKQMAALHDLRSIRQGIYPDPEIYANDIVYVGESTGRRAFQLAVQSGALLSAPLIAILN